MLLIRFAFGGLMIVNHGMKKMDNFDTLKDKFADPFHLGTTASLILAIFAEVFCSALVVLGLFTRLAVIPLIITMIVAIFMAHGGDVLVAEMAALYLAVYILLLLVGPGKASIDGMKGK